MSGSRVYIGRLPQEVRESEVERFFKGFGRIREILLKNGYGFVEFENHRDADDAVYELDGKELLGARVVVEPAKRTARGGRYDDRRSGGGGGGRFNERSKQSGSSRFGPPRRTGHSLVVENISSRISWQDLKDFMRKAGEVTYADAHRQRRNEGVVEFASSSDLRTAIKKLDGTELGGRRIRLIESRHEKRSSGERRYSRSSSSSPRPRRRSRSKSQRASGSRSKSQHTSRSRSKTRSRSRSHGKQTKSKSPVKSRSRSPSRSQSHTSPDASRKRSRSQSNPSKSDSRSHSRSSEKRRSRSRSKKPKRDSRSQSNKPCDDASRSRSRSKSASQGSNSSSRSGSRSLSRSDSRSSERSASAAKSRSRSRS